MSGHSKLVVLMHLLYQSLVLDGGGATVPQKVKRLQSDKVQIR